MFITNNQLEKHPQYELVRSLEFVQNNLVMARLSMVFTDEKTDWENPGLSLIAIWPDSMELYFQAKRYNISNEMEPLVVAVAKERTKLAAVFVYGEQMFQYTDEGEGTGFGVNNLQPVSNLVDLYPNVMLWWNFTDAATHRQKWLHLTQNLTLVTEQQKALYDVVVNASMHSPDVNRTIYFCMEPFGEKQYAQYLRMLCMNNQRPVFLGLHKHHLNNCEWHLKPSLGQLKRMKVDKTHDRVLSVVVSAKAQDPGHKYRLALIKRLDELSDKLPFKLDIYGRCAALKFKNYRKELPDQEKDEAIFSYKYHLNVENHSYDNYITEKLYDAICGECVLFYHGAPNFRQFFTSPIGLSGDIESIDADVKLITESIVQDTYSQKLSQIQADKHRLLTQYAFEPRVLSIIKLSKINCVVSDESTKLNLLDQGFRTAEVQPKPFKLDVIISSSIHQAQPLLIKMSSNHYPNLLDRLCFTLSANPEADVIGIKDPGEDNLIDILLLPSGQEQMLKNIVQKRTLFEKLKFCKLL